MNQKPMTPEQEYEYYAQPENQEPQGAPRRRDRSRLTAMVPVRFSPELAEEVRRRADADDRSLSSGSAAPSNTSYTARPDPVSKASRSSILI